MSEEEKKEKAKEILKSDIVKDNPIAQLIFGKLLENFKEDKENMNINEELEKKNKIIDLMAEKMKITRYLTSEEYENYEHDEQCNGQVYMTKEEIKQYFEKKVESEK